MGRVHRELYEIRGNHGRIGDRHWFKVDIFPDGLVFVFQRSIGRLTL